MLLDGLQLGHCHLERYIGKGDMGEGNCSDSLSRYERHKGPEQLCDHFMRGPG